VSGKKQKPGNYGTREWRTSENAKSEQHHCVTSSLFELYRTTAEQINNAGEIFLTSGSFLQPNGAESTRLWITGIRLHSNVSGG